MAALSALCKHRSPRSSRLHPLARPPLFEGRRRAFAVLILAPLAACTSGRDSDSVPPPDPHGLGLTILSPLDGTVIDGSVSTLAAVTLSDDATPVEELVALWAAGPGMLGYGQADADGFAYAMITVPAGTTTLDVAAADPNTSDYLWKHTSVRVDTQPPTLAFTSPFDGEAIALTELAGTLTDDVATSLELTLDVTVDGALANATLLSDGTFTVDLPADLAPGWHDAEAEAKDINPGTARTTIAAVAWIHPGTLIASPTASGTYCELDPVTLSTMYTTAADTLLWSESDGSGGWTPLGASVAGDQTVDWTFSAGHHDLQVEVLWARGGTSTDAVGFESGAAGWVYTDGDFDGYGDSATAQRVCEPGVGEVVVALDGDCDDADASLNPGVTEICDDVDRDCDGLADADDPDAGAATWYADVDGDGYGDPAVSAVGCDAPNGYVAVAGDCDDDDLGANPGTVEICDMTDNDCDGDTDENDAYDATTWYRDSDADGYGDPAVSLVQCYQPAGYEPDMDDCDDGRFESHPYATEFCNTYDDDCDGDVDEPDAVDASTFYKDDDGDGFGDAGTGSTTCYLSAGITEDATDCDDADAAVSPDGIEICNSIDDDCDLLVDDEDSPVDGRFTWYADADGDGYGNAGDEQLGCLAPDGFIADDTDCDDGDGQVYPGAREYCDLEDDDCDGEIDESSAEDATTWYLDSDGDGYGTTATTSRACAAPSGYIARAGDCDDSEAEAWTGRPEFCDGVDNDCRGGVDDFADGLEVTPDEAGSGVNLGIETSFSTPRTVGGVLTGGDEDWYVWTAPGDYGSRAAPSLHIVGSIGAGETGDLTLELFKSDTYNAAAPAPELTDDSAPIDLTWGDISDEDAAPPYWYLRVTASPCAASYSLTFSRI